MHARPRGAPHCIEAQAFQAECRGFETRLPLPELRGLQVVRNLESRLDDGNRGRIRAILLQMVGSQHEPAVIEAALAALETTTSAKPDLRDESAGQRT